MRHSFSSNTMNTKRSAWFFLFLVCSSHVFTSLAHHVPSTKPEEGCVIDAKFQLIVTQSMEKIKLKVKKVYEVEDLSVQDFKLSKVNCHGLHNLKVTGFACKCYKDFLRVFIRISLFDILFTFVLSLNGILGGALSGLINTLVGLLQRVVNLLVKLLILKIDFLAVVDYHYNGHVEVVKLFLDEVEEVRVLNIDLTSTIKGLLNNLVGELLVEVAKLLFTQELKDEIIAELTALKIEKNWHNCVTTVVNPPLVCHKCCD